MTPNDVVSGYRVRRGKITVQMLRDAPDDENKYVLFEGNSSALEFLGRLLIAQALDKSDCDFHLAPIGPGGVFFTDDSDVGVYIHRLPCTVKRGFRQAKSLWTKKKGLRRRGRLRK